MNDSITVKVKRRGYILPRDNDVINEKMKHVPKEKSIQPSNKFTEQEIDLAKTPLFFPKGYENIFLTLYFIFLPYIVGILFLFLYASEGKTEMFITVNKLSSVIVTWSIGYEIIAVFIILYVIKMAISFSTSKKKKEPFKRP